MQENTALSDAFDVALSMSRQLKGDTFGIVGYGVAELRDSAGNLKEAVPFANLVTTVGDEYYARKAIAAVGPATAAAPTAASGMQIGSGATAASKSGVGAALGTLLAGQAFDATYPQAAAVAGTDTGWNATYRTTYAAGTGTGAVTEAVITNTPTLGTAALAATTIARVTFAAVNKAAGDSLTLTWSTKFLGA